MSPRKPRRKGGTLKDGERRQLARASRHGPAGLPDRTDRPLLLCDGGSRGNPGTAAIAAVLIDGERVVERSALIGHAGAAEAEYRAIVLGLELAASEGVTELEVRCDSQLAISALRSRGPATGVIDEVRAAAASQDPDFVQAADDLSKVIDREVISLVTKTPYSP